MIAARRAGVRASNAHAALSVLAEQSDPGAGWNDVFNAPYGCREQFRPTNTIVVSSISLLHSGNADGRAIRVGLGGAEPGLNQPDPAWLAGGTAYADSTMPVSGGVRTWKTYALPAPVSIAAGAAFTLIVSAGDPRVATIDSPNPVGYSEFSYYFRYGVAGVADNYFPGYRMIHKLNG